jgi:hypothetical protein
MINNNFRALNNEQVTKLYNDSSGTPNILIGLDSTGNSRIKVAPPGVDVTTATDTQLLFNSAQNVFKIVSIKTFSITQPAGSVNTYSRTHGLTYVPAVMGFLSAGGGLFRPLPTHVSISSDTVAEVVKIGAWVDCQADATNVTVTFRNATSAPMGNYNFKIYVLQETAE